MNPLADFFQHRPKLPQKHLYNLHPDYTRPLWQLPPEGRQNLLSNYDVPWLRPTDELAA